MFLPNECPGLCRHRSGHSLGEKIKLHEIKKMAKATLAFRIYNTYMANFEAIRQVISSL